MINPGKSFNISDYVEIFLRWIWYVIVPFILIMIITVSYIVYTPKQYLATTLILVTPQKVPEAYVRSTVTSRIEDRLQSISQEILSRTHLEQLISGFKLYPEEAKSLPMEGVVELMRRNIKVEIRGKEGYFSISYTGKDPQVVTRVANKLASLFIEENLKLREQQAQGTSEFLAIELNAKKTKLEELEKAISQFKRQYMGELPEQRDANLRLLEQQQLNSQRISDSLRAAKDRKIMIQKQLSDLETLTISAANTVIMEEPNSPQSSPSMNPMQADRRAQIGPKEINERQLEQLKNQLADLQAKYTGRHPDILTTKRRIVDLEEKIQKIRLERDAEENKIAQQEPVMEAKKGKQDEKSDFKNPFFQEMKSQLEATEMEIQRLNREDEKVKAQIAKYHDRIENTFLREQAMANLSRDYQNTNAAYQALLNKSQEAQQSENLEHRQKGEQFKIIDPARVPVKPYKPDVTKILLLGTVLGVGFGFGIAFFKEQMDRSFRDAEDLEATLGFRVLANIPKIEKKAA